MTSSAPASDRPAAVVPPLPLEQLMTMSSKMMDSPSCHLQLAGSDRSCTTTRAPLSAHDNSAPTTALRCNEAVDADAPTPRFPATAVECSTPRSAVGQLASLCLRSPHAAPVVMPPPPLSADAYRTPTGTPRISPHSPRSPSMMSPLRLVGTKSPCSVRLTGSARLAGGAVLPLTSATTATATAINKAARPASAPVSARDPLPTIQFKTTPKPPVQRSLPFSGRTPAAAAALGARNSIGLSQGRELSFSDLLSKHGNPLTTTGSGSGSGGRSSKNSDGSLPLPPPPLLPCTGGATTISGDISGVDLGASPRKRARKNAAPQRATEDETMA